MMGTAAGSYEPLYTIKEMLKNKLLTQLIRLIIGGVFAAVHIYYLLHLPKYVPSILILLHLLTWLIALIRTGNGKKANIYYGIIYGIGLIACIPFLYILIGILYNIF